MKAIYFHIQKVTAVRREDIPGNLEALQKGLEKIFGEGAKMTETAIVRSLCQKLVQPKEDKDKCFIERINYALKAATIKSGYPTCHDMIDNNMVTGEGHKRSRKVFRLSTKLIFQK
jgi:hypothetical protein